MKVVCMCARVECVCMYTISMFHVNIAECIFEFKFFFKKTRSSLPLTAIPKIQKVFL